MTLIELTRQVKATRDLQREFFRTPAAERPPDLLKRCREAERLLDKLAEEVLSGQSLSH